MPTTGTIRHLLTYPVKGLSAQPLDSVALDAGTGFPLDRAFGLARPGSGFDPANPRPLPKSRFVVLARDAMLALLDTHYDEATGMLRLAKDGTAETFDIATAAGAAAASRFVAQAARLPEDEVPTLAYAGPHRFTDVSVVSPQMMNAISLINLDSVAHFAETIGRDVSPHRFRANILFDGFPALAELEMEGMVGRLGTAEIRILKRTQRCPATQVNLETGARDIDVPALLTEHYGHADMGVYAEVITAGTVAPGDQITL